MAIIVPARRTCGAMLEHRKLLNEDPLYASTRLMIESQARGFRLADGAGLRPGITRIPTVVHDALNKDFRMTNPDVAGVPNVWQHLVAAARIEFFLATKVRQQG